MVEKSRKSHCARNFGTKAFEVARLDGRVSAGRLRKISTARIEIKVSCGCEFEDRGEKFEKFSIGGLNRALNGTGGPSAGAQRWGGSIFESRRGASVACCAADHDYLTRTARSIFPPKKMLTSLDFARSSTVSPLPHRRDPKARCARFLLPGSETLQCQQRSSRIFLRHSLEEALIAKTRMKRPSSGDERSPKDLAAFSFFLESRATKWRENTATS